MDFWPHEFSTAWHLLGRAQARWFELSNEDSGLGLEFRLRLKAEFGLRLEIEPKKFEVIE